MVKDNTSPDQGFTLIELMVTIVIMTILALTAFQLGRGWIANNRIIETHSKIQVVFEKAQAFAIRNSDGVIEDQTAVSIVISDDQAIATSSEGDTVWQERIDPRASVSIEGDCESIELTNQGRLLDNSCSRYTVEFPGGSALNAPFN